jgi:hypothetical protein
MEDRKAQQTAADQYFRNAVDRPREQHRTQHKLKNQGRLHEYT